MRLMGWRLRLKVQRHPYRSSVFLPSRDCADPFPAESAFCLLRHPP